MDLITKNKLDISVLILTYNEEIHIRRCLENLASFVEDIFIVDSYSTDKTLDIAREFRVHIFQNKWENNYAKQLNWGLTHCPIHTKWVLRLDADEYLSLELLQELKDKLNILPEEVTGVIFKRRHIFMGKWMKRGTYPVKLLRLFQTGKGFCEQRWMDEHIRLTEGRYVEFENDFVDHNLNNMDWWTAKHNGYSIREAIDLLNIELDLFLNEDGDTQLNNQAAVKRKKKYKYAYNPLFLRSFAYFIYRYIFKLGFTEGKEGFLWHFLQGWWYRTLVDVKIYEIKKACGTDKEKIRVYIRKHYSIEI